MYIYGKNVLREKINNNEEISKVYLSNNFSDKDIVKLLNNKKIKIEYLPINKMDNMIKGNHQGVIIEIDDFKYSNLEEVLNNLNKPYPLFVMLDHLEDPHNLGAIIRTSEALGVDGIIIPNKRSVSINGTVIKTSAGAISYIPVIEVSNLVNTIEILKKKGYWIIGTDMNETDINDIDYSMPIVLVIGSEGSGMSDLVKKKCDFIASIPMVGKINSLNASVATGIMLYNIVNKRK